MIISDRGGDDDNLTQAMLLLPSRHNNVDYLTPATAHNNLAPTRFVPYLSSMLISMWSSYLCVLFSYPYVFLSGTLVDDIVLRDWYLDDRFPVVRVCSTIPSRYRHHPTSPLPQNYHHPTSPPPPNYLTK